MKFINLLIWAISLLNFVYSPISCNEMSQVSANQAIIIFIEDLHTHTPVNNVSIQAIYGGYLTTSNHNGQIILPRKTEEANFKIIVTNPSVMPVFTILNNISHFQIPQTSEAIMYNITMNRSKKNLAEWVIKQEPLPQDRHVPLHAIVIFADPKAAIIQTGKSITHLSEQLVLPNIYIDQTQPFNDISSMALLNNRPFLKKLQTAYTLTPYGYATLQVY